MPEGSPGRSKIKRKPRMDPAEVRRRTLSTAENLVLGEGLMASMDHISLEDIIVQAQVPRSAVHRMWPYKEDFFADLVLQLAERSEVSPSVYDPETLRVAVRALEDNWARLSTAEGRLSTLVEVCRQGSMRNFEANLERPSLRSYIVLSATGMSFEDDVRRALQESLAKSELSYLQGMAQFYESMFSILGRRMLPQFSGRAMDRAECSYLAEVCSSAIQGQVLRTVLTGGGVLPDLKAVTAPADPFNVGDRKPWNGPSLSFTSTFLAMTEAEPDFVHDPGESQEKINEIKTRIAGVSPESSP